MRDNSMHAFEASECIACMHVFACCMALMVQLPGFGNAIQKFLATKHQTQKNLDVSFLAKTCCCQVFGLGQNFLSSKRGLNRWDIVP